jgi:hypothetical protein
MPSRVPVKVLPVVVVTETTFSDSAATSVKYFLCATDTLYFSIKVRNCTYHYLSLIYKEHLLGFNCCFFCVFFLIVVVVWLLSTTTSQGLSFGLHFAEGWRRRLLSGCGIYHKLPHLL